MKAQNLSAKITLWVNRCIAHMVIALIFLLPSIIDWYCQFRILAASERTAITIAFYCCVAVVGVALWQIDRLLTAILAEAVFIRQNVRRIRTIQWCCGTISLICVPAAFAYLPLIFMVIIMAFLCLGVGAGACGMDAAGAIREENDLTV